MSFIGLKLAHETARLLSEIEVPGRKESLDFYHLTVLHLGDSLPIETVARAMVATFQVTSVMQPFTVRLNRVSCFDKNSHGVPIICRAESDSLHELWSALKTSFDNSGLDYSKKFPEFKPHVTLSYAEEPIEDLRIPTVEWGAHELILWGGDTGDRRVVVTFPLSLNLAKRVACRFSSMDESYWESTTP